MHLKAMGLHRNSGAFTMQKDCYYTPKAMFFASGYMAYKKHW